MMWWRRKEPCLYCGRGTRKADRRGLCEVCSVVVDNLIVESERVMRRS